MRRPITKDDIKRGLESPTQALVDLLLQPAEVDAMSKFYDVAPEVVRETCEQLVRRGAEFVVAASGDLFLRRHP